MPRRRLLLALPALAGVLWCSAAAAGPAAAVPAKSAPAGDEVQVSAERVERETAARVMTAEGAVVIRHREMQLSADRVVYHETGREVIADGNVVFETGADRLQGTHMELNLQTRVGFIERAQGFVQEYFLTGERIEKRGPDRYFIRNGSFTTCEGALPDWSFHTTSTNVTIDEYLYAWNPNLRLKRLPVFYVPYAVFPIKRDRSTGLLVPQVSYSDRDGLVVRNQFYWAPRDNFDATLGVDYRQETGWGGDIEMRYLLAPRTQGTFTATYLDSSSSASGGGERWSIAARNSHELPLELHLEAEAFFQSDRQYTATYGDTIEERSTERTTSSFYLDRSWSAWTFALSGRLEESLLTERSTTLTRFPELTIDRTGTRLFETDLFLKLNMSGVALRRESGDAEVRTTRWHAAPELTWPLPVGSVARLLPSISYDLTHYSEDLDGEPETRSLPTYRLALEGPKFYRIWDASGGSTEKYKHLIEPRVSYIYTPGFDQERIPQFDSIDHVEEANRIEYSLTNTLYAKVRRPAPPAGGRARGQQGAAEGAAGEGGAEPAGESEKAPGTTAQADEARAGERARAGGAGAEAAQASTVTKELLWVKLSQSYSMLTEDDPALPETPFSPLEWEARAQPGGGVDLSWRGTYNVYENTVDYQNVLATWSPTATSTLRGEWRNVRESNQDYLDLGAELGLGRFTLDGRSRYNLAEGTFVENRASVKYTSQCWDVTVGYVKWPDNYEYSLLISFKGIGTVMKL